MTRGNAFNASACPTQGKNYGPQITVKRLAVRSRACKPIFLQIARQVVRLRPADLRLPSRAWKVGSLCADLRLPSRAWKVGSRCRSATAQQSLEGG